MNIVHTLPHQFDKYTSVFHDSEMKNFRDSEIKKANCNSLGTDHNGSMDIMPQANRIIEASVEIYGTEEDASISDHIKLTSSNEDSSESGVPEKIEQVEGTGAEIVNGNGSE